MNMPPEAVPANGSHSQPMNTFQFHRNCTSRNHGTAGNREAGNFVNMPPEAVPANGSHSQPMNTFSVP